MRQDYDNLGEVFDELENLAAGRPEYQILQGTIYDTLRWHVNTDIPDSELADVSRLLHSGEVDEAYDKVGEYLDPETVEPLGDDEV